MLRLKKIDDKDDQELCLSEDSSVDSVSSKSSQKDVYEKAYGMFKTKHILVGNKHQIDKANIPLLTDILENPELYEL